MGAHAAGAGPESFGARLEPARLGPVDRKDSPWRAAAEGKPVARNWADGPAGRRAAAIPSGGSTGRGRQRNRQNGAADCLELAAPAADGGERDYGRAR